MRYEDGGNIMLMQTLVSLRESFFDSHQHMNWNGLFVSLFGMLVCKREPTRRSLVSRLLERFIV